MKFTFGIVTGKNSIFIQKCIESIYSLRIPEFEIVVVGNNLPFDDPKIKFIQYNDIYPQGDISIKKNLITDIANFTNIVYLHDYIQFDSNWYSGFLKYGEDFDLCMTKIFNVDGLTRYRDWTLWAYDGEPILKNNHYLIPYEMSHLTKLMYFSGAYWVGKKDFMLENRLDNTLPWGHGEDVEWSKRVRQKTTFKMNQYSAVKLLKYKDRAFEETNKIDEELLNNLVL